MGKASRILVVSSANIDFVQNMTKMPYAGETIIENDYGYSYVPGGKGANSATAFARFGADCVFATRLGNDANAKRLIKLYEEEGIDTRYIIRDPEKATGFASIMVESNGKNRIVVYPGANSALNASDVENSFMCYPDAVYLQFEIPEEAVITASQTANKLGIPVFVDAGPARTDFPLKQLGKVEIFSPNETETRIFTGIAPQSEESTLRAAIKLSSMVDAKYIVIKCGDKGAFIFDKKEYYMIPAEEVNAIDTTAAGDVFSAVMTYVYLQTGNIVTAVKYANIAGGLATERAGAIPSIPTREQVTKFAREKVAREKSANQEVAKTESETTTESGENA